MRWLPLAMVPLVTACAALAPVEQNAAELRALTPAAYCETQLPFFGYYRYSRDELLQYQAPDGRITTGNDGGWCVITYQALMPNGGYTIASGDVLTPPAHGQAMLGSLGGLLRIAYRPAPGFAGGDHFVVRLRNPLPYDVPVTVTVTPGRTAAGG